MHLSSISLAILLLGISLPFSVVAEDEGGWWGKTSELGVLCDTNNSTDTPDVIGRKLGCNCTFINEHSQSVGHGLIATCSGRNIGFNNTLILPPRLNISTLVRKLDMSQNNLNSIDENTFGDCEGLSELFLNRNQITSVVGISCSRLVSLDLSYNHITNLTVEAFKNLSRLQNLDLSHNNLIFLEVKVFEQLSQLKRLNLASNPLGEEVLYDNNYALSLARLKFLEELDMSNTSLQEFPEYIIDGSIKVRRLSLKNNNIIHLPKGVFKELHMIEELDLSGNLMKTLPPSGFHGLYNLKSLKINVCPQLKTIENYAFSGLSSLSELKIQRNYVLTSIDENAFKADPDQQHNASDSLPKSIYLTSNNLQKIDYNLLPWEKIETIELSRNNWICDCNLQWVPEFAKKDASKASVLINGDFKCQEPPTLRSAIITDLDPSQLECSSKVATVALTISIILFVILLSAFCTILVLNQLGLLPEWIKRYNICGSNEDRSLPKYKRVQPRPSSGPPDQSQDLEWDTGDIGR